MSNYLTAKNDIIDIRSVDNLIISPLRLSVSVNFDNPISHSGGSALKDLKMERQLIKEMVNIMEGFQAKNAYIFSKVKCGTMHEASKNYGPFVMRLPENIFDIREEDSESAFFSGIFGGNKYPIVGSETLSEVPMRQRMNDTLMNKTIESFSYNSLEGSISVLTLGKLRQREIDILNSLGNRINYLTLVNATAFGQIVEKRLFDVTQEQILTKKPEPPSEWDLGD